MSQTFRHPDILEIARRQGKVTVEALAEHFGVTVQTIRRDLSDLADAGKLERVHGGAILPSGVSNIGYEHRRGLHEGAKAAIAARCAAAIPGNASVFLNIGTSTEAVARALMLEPRVLVLDEPVSALDLSIQSQILNLLVDLQERLGLAYLFISHDLSVVKHMADDIIVMYLGRPVETGPKDAIFKTPRHPYTKALLSATPVADPLARKERIKLEGELPSPLNLPSGCAFAPRCWKAKDRCRKERPELDDGAHRAACFYPEA